MNTRSLGFRLMQYYTFLLAGVFLLFGIFMYLDLKRHLEQDLEDRMFRLDWLIARRLLLQVGQTGEQYVIDEINSRVAPTLLGRFIRITRSDGTLMYVSGQPDDHSFDATAISLVSPPVRRIYTRKELRAEGTEMMIVSVPTEAQDHTQFTIEAGAPTKPLQDVLDRFLTSMILGALLVLIVAIGGGQLLVRNALTPVDRMARSAEQITLRSLSDRLPITATGDELERLSMSLNHMITRLDESFQQTRRFIADASHELRTPLTIMRGELENMLLEPELPVGLRESIGSALEEVDRLAKIVESLFALSRIDAGEAQTDWVCFDLSELTANTADQMCQLAEDKGIGISCAAPHPVLVEGDRARIKQVVVNLLDNAIKYTPPGGAVSLTVGSTNGSAVLEVVDNGIGIPANALPNVFDRFFRVDKARSREMGGAGIGLSIVKAICTAHHGRVEVKSTEGQGSRFEVILPLATRGT